MTVQEPVHVDDLPELPELPEFPVIPREITEFFKLRDIPSMNNKIQEAKEL